RQIDVHVGEDVGVALRPDVAQCPSSALLVEMDRADAIQASGQLPRDGEGGVGAGVVRDRDAKRERKALAKVLVKPGDAVRQDVRLVVDRHDDLDKRSVGDGLLSVQHARYFSRQSWAEAVRRLRVARAYYRRASRIALITACATHRAVTRKYVVS